MNKLPVLGVDISIDSKQQLRDQISSFLNSKKGDILTIVTPNPEQIVLAQKDEKFKSILNGADIALPDGAGVVWALGKVKSSKSKVQSGNEKTLRTSNFELPTTFTRIPGIEFMEDLVKLASQNYYPVALIGGNPGTGAQTLKNLYQKYTSLIGIIHELPPLRVMPMDILSSGRHERFNQLCVDKDSSRSLDEIVKETAQKIIETKSRIVFISLGAPKQEYFMEKLRSWFIVHSNQVVVHSSPKKSSSNSELRTSNSIILMVVGGSFDVLSGNISRAPEFIRNLNLEWLWRLIQEPWRIGRQLNLLKFLWLVFRLD